MLIIVSRAETKDVIVMKYKHCHVVENNRKGKNAFVDVTNGGIQGYKLLTDQQVLNIKVHDTFSEADMGSASM